MTTQLEQQVQQALRKIVDPCSIATGAPIDLLDMGLIREIEVQATFVVVELRLTSPFCLQAELICQQIRDKVGDATGLEVLVKVNPTDDWEPQMIASSARLRLRAIRP